MSKGFCDASPNFFDSLKADSMACKILSTSMRFSFFAIE